MGITSSISVECIAFRNRPQQPSVMYICSPFALPQIASQLKRDRINTRRSITTRKWLHLVWQHRAHTLSVWQYYDNPYRSCRPGAVNYSQSKVCMLLPLRPQITFCSPHRCIRIFARSGADWVIAHCPQIWHRAHIGALVVYNYFTSPLYRNIAPEESCISSWIWNVILVTRVHTRQVIAYIICWSR